MKRASGTILRWRERFATVRAEEGDTRLAPPCSPAAVAAGLWRDERGASALEYAVVAGVMVVAVALGFPPLSAAVADLYNTVIAALPPP